MKHILVTGVEGFIGRRLVRALKQTDFSVIELGRRQGDIIDPATFEQFCDTPVDYVFHLAGRTYVPDSWENPAEYHRVNVSGTLNVLEFCRERKIPMTYLSAYLYGVPASLPIKETDRVEPNNPYALSKLMAETLCNFYTTYFDVPVAIIRPFNIYGPGQKAHFLIPKIIRQIKAGKPIHVKDLAPRRDYLHLDDLIDGLLLTMEGKSGCRIYNFGYGSSLSVKEIIDAIQLVMGTSLEIISEEQPRKNEIQDVYADISKVREELGWQPIHNFEQGIKELLTSEESRSE